MNLSSSAVSSMRVLVADPHWQQCALIEKNLAMLGYFRICPATSFGELTQLTHYNPGVYDRFDLLIVNADLVSTAGCNVSNFCLNSARLKHVLIYGAPDEQAGARTLSAQPHHQVRMVDAISHGELVDFLSLIDSDGSPKKHPGMRLAS